MKLYLKSNYKTRILRPTPECMSVSDKNLPPDILCKIFVVACPTCKFFLFAATAIAVNGVAILIAGYETLFQAAWVRLTFFVTYF